MPRQCSPRFRQELVDRMLPGETVLSPGSAFFRVKPVHRFHYLTVNRFHLCHIRAGLMPLGGDSDRLIVWGGSLSLGHGLAEFSQVCRREEFLNSRIV